MFGDNKYLLIARVLKCVGVTPQPADLITDLLEKYLKAIGGQPSVYPDNYVAILAKIVAKKGGVPTPGDREWDLLVKWLIAIGKTHSFADSIVDLWRKILAASESSPPMVPPSTLQNNLISHWKLNETSGSPRNDSHTSNHLTDTNGVAQASGAPIPPGLCAEFVAAGFDSLDRPSPHTGLGGHANFTFAGWVRFATPFGPSGLIGLWEQELLLSYIVYWDGVNHVRFHVTHDGAGASNVFVTDLTNLVADTWYFVVVWHDSVADTINIQVNNGTIYSTAHALGVFFDSSTNFSLGRDQNGGTWLQGRMDSWSLWSRVLTPAEKTQLYNGGAGLDYPF